MSCVTCGSHFLSSCLGLFWNVLDTFQYRNCPTGFLPGCLRMDQILNSFGDIVVNACDSLRLHEECDLLSLRIDKVSRFGVFGGQRVRAFPVNCLSLDWFQFAEMTEMTETTLKCFVQSLPCCGVAGHAVAWGPWGPWGPGLQPQSCSRSRRVQCGPQDPRRCHFGGRVVFES